VNSCILPAIAFASTCCESRETIKTYRKSRTVDGDQILMHYKVAED
jgi:hypothetical protein